MERPGRLPMSDPNNVIPLVDAARVEAQAAEWIARLDRDAPTESDLADFAAWKALSPMHRQAAERLSGLWSDFDLLAGQEDALAPAVASAGQASPAPWPRRSLASLVAACLLVVALGISGVWLYMPQTQVYDTGIGGQKTINLEDGSSIQLNTNSKVEVRYTSRTRDLRLLRGEAYFEVSPDPARPFSVYARQDVVRAVGTAFVVRLRGEGVEVTVTKGRVELATLSRPPAAASLDRISTAPRRPLTLMTAQDGGTELALVNRSSLVEQIELAPPDVLRKLAWRQGMLIFNGEDLSSVVADVSRYTDVRIEIADPSLKSLKVGGYFKVGEVEPMLEALESGFGVEVERVGEKLVRLSAAP